MTFANLGSFLLVALLVELTPGPNMVYLAFLSATEGRRAGLAAVLGVAIGLLGIGTAVALGLAGVSSASPIVYETLRWAGVAYMVWLAWDCWRSQPEAASPGRALTEVDGFRRGLITNLLNPKAGVFFIAILPRFVDPSRPLLTQTLGLTATYVAVATAVHLNIVALAGQATPFLQRSAHAQSLRAAFAVSLLGVAAWFAIGTARPH